MAKYRNLDRGDVLPASWTDAVQEFISTVAAGLRLTASNATTVQAAASTNSGQVSVGIDGLFRYRTTSATATASGGAGARDIFVVTAANAFTNSPQPDTDNTDYGWYLQVLASGATPAGTISETGAAIAAYRKVGELDWDGAAITGIRQIVGAEDATQPVTAIAPRANMVPSRAIGATGHTANLFEGRVGLTGSNVFSVAASGAITSASTITGTTINATAGLQVAGVALASTHLTDTAALARLAGPTFTGVPSGPTAGVDTNTTQLATTQYVIGQGYLKSATATSTYVPIAGASTITGAKIFSSNPIIDPGTGTAAATLNLTARASGAAVATTIQAATNGQLNYASAASQQHQWFAGASNIATLSGTGALTLGGVINATGVQVSSTALAASHLSNGVVGTGAVVLASSATLIGATLNRPDNAGAAVSVGNGTVNAYGTLNLYNAAGSLSNNFYITGANTTKTDGSFAVAGNLNAVTVTPGRFIGSGTTWAFTTYTGDGVWHANATPSQFTGTGTGILKMGYSDRGAGEYAPSLGFSGQNNTSQNWGNSMMVLQTRVDRSGTAGGADTGNRFQIAFDGTMGWGAAPAAGATVSAGVDTSLSRESTNFLAISGHLRIGSNLFVGSSGTGFTFYSDGTAGGANLLNQAATVWGKLTLGTLLAQNGVTTGTVQASTSATIAIKSGINRATNDHIIFHAADGEIARFAPGGYLLARYGLKVDANNSAEVFRVATTTWELGFFGKTPSRSAGWSAPTNYSGRTTLNRASYTMNDLADYVCTIGNALVNYGLLSAT